MFKSIGRLFKSVLGTRSKPAITCRHASEGGCSFKGSREKVVAHEAKCGRRMVQCPRSATCGMLPVKKVVKHLREAHKAPVIPISDKFKKLVSVFWLPKGESHMGVPRAMLWKLFIDAEQNKECCLIPHVEGTGEHIKIWLLVQSGDNSQLKGLKCRISMKHNGNEMEWIAPVYPVATTKERIRSDGKFASIAKEDLEKYAITDSEYFKKQGIASAYKVTFQLVKI